MECVFKSFNDLSVSELYEILKVRQDVFVVEQKCAYPVIDGIDIDSTHVFLHENGCILAYLRYFSVEEGIRIGRVLTTVRGKNYGFMVMISALEHICSTADVRHFVLGAQVYATGFYRKFVFSNAPRSILKKISLMSRWRCFWIDHSNNLICIDAFLVSCGHRSSIAVVERTAFLRLCHLWLLKSWVQKLSFFLFTMSPTLIYRTSSMLLMLF